MTARIINNRLVFQRVIDGKLVTSLTNPGESTMSNRYPNVTLPVVRVIPFTDLDREESAQVERQCHDIDDRREVLPGWTYQDIIDHAG